MLQVSKCLNNSNPFDNFYVIISKIVRIMERSVMYIKFVSFFGVLVIPVECLSKSLHPFICMKQLENEQTAFREISTFKF
jgi:hypothetical protein